MSNDEGSATISSTGVLTGVSPGKVTVTATYTHSSISEWSASYVVDIIPIKPGVYFIQNRQKGGYIQIDDNASDNYSESGVHMEHHDFDGGENIQQDDYLNNNSYLDEWYLIAEFSANSMGGEFHSGQDVVDAAKNWASCGYQSNYNIDPNINDLNQGFFNSSVVYFSAHGSQHSIQLYNSVWVTNEAAADISNSVNISNFSRDVTKLYIYDACLTASDEDGSGQNLCTRTLAAGADCVIGWTQEIVISDSREWQSRFQSKLIDGFTVYQAASYANRFSYVDNVSIKSWRIYGNSSMIINESSTYSNSNIDNSISTSMVFTIESKEEIDNVVKKFIPSFDDFVFEKSIAYTNSELTNYVVDYVCTYNGFKTDYGISVIVENGEIVQISNRTDGFVVKEEKANVPLNQASKEQALSDAYDEAKNNPMFHKLSKQTYDLYYDVDNNIYYYRVKTIYETVAGQVGAIITLHKI